jgi:glutaredoxin 3
MIPISENRVKIYTKLNCSYCVDAKIYLNAHNVKYEEILISKEDMKDFRTVCPTAKTVPQIIFDGKLIGGYDDLKKSTLVHDYHCSKLTE